MKLEKLCIIILLFTLISCEKEIVRPKAKIQLEVISAFDERLTEPSPKDIEQILNESKKSISERFGDNVILEFHDNGRVTLNQLFAANPYESSEHYFVQSEFKFNYEEDYPSDYTPKYKHVWLINRSGGSGNIMQTKPGDFWEEYAEHLKQWKLKSLENLFPGSNMQNYTMAGKIIFQTYLHKISELKKIKTPKGETLVKIPAVPWQSETEWISFMHEQSKYDLVITNTLIVSDTLSFPHPHIISHSGKLGGGGLISPKRKPMQKNSIVISLLSEYGNIKEFSKGTNVSNEMKNKVIAAALLTHEIGHALYSIPDVYDHEPDCVMNSTKETVDLNNHFKKMNEHKRICKLCSPWIVYKNKFFDAMYFYEKQDFEQAGDLFLKAIKFIPDNTPEKNNILESIYELAMESYQKANNRKKFEKVNSLYEELKNN